MYFAITLINFAANMRIYYRKYAVFILFFYRKEVALFLLR